MRGNYKCLGVGMASAGGVVLARSVVRCDGCYNARARLPGAGAGCYTSPRAVSLARSWKPAPRLEQVLRGPNSRMAQNLIVEPNSDATDTPGDTTAPTDFQLGVEGFAYGDLYRPSRLRDLAEAFYAEVERADPSLHAALTDYLASRGENVRGTKAESDLLIAAAPHLSRFVARLFGVEREREELMESVRAQDPVFQFKHFVQRRATKSFPAEKAAGVDVESADAALEALRRAAFADTLADDRELGVARTALRLLEWEKNYPKEGARREEEWSEARAREIEAARAKIAGTEVERALAAWREGEDEGGAEESRAVAADENRAFVRAALRLLEAWAAAHALRAEVRERVKAWVSFRFPHPLNYEHLVQIERPEADLPELVRGLDKNLRRRDGFKLTDARYTPREVQDEVNYCLYCHERDKDSCSKGLKERDGSLKKNPLGITLGGCPLDEKISEMHLLQKEGDSIAALALVVIDNPMCPGTGHRICNDCMKACIFQKQEPVNIPQAETGVLTNALARRDHFRFYGGVRFGGTLSIEDAWALGFDHIAVATGAGKPTIVEMKNNLIRGIRKASDFLMALQLTGAAKRDSMANLQVRLPAVVIGGGLTAIDTATELFAYYHVQVEKTLDRFEKLVVEVGDA